jgi:hypothetical protein
MWILPKQLHTSPFVPDTAALISDSTEQSEICAQSLLARSKPSPARTWSQRWKRDSWTQHLSGRILKPSHGPSFVTAWISFRVDTRASRSAQPANASEPKTHDTSGRLSQPELLQCDQVPAFLKTSTDISRWGFPTCCKTWQDWVTERRGAWRARVNAARLTRGKESGSWPILAWHRHGERGQLPDWWREPAEQVPVGYGETWRDGRGLENTNSGDAWNRGTHGLCATETRSESLQQERQANGRRPQPAGGDTSTAVWPSRPGEQQFAWEPPRVVATWEPPRVVLGNASSARHTRQARSGGECAQGQSLGHVAQSNGAMGHPNSPRPQERPRQRAAGIQGADADGGEAADGEAEFSMGDPAYGTSVGLRFAELSGLSDQELAEIRHWMVASDNRTDELRLLGNGVVPAVAERAFRLLFGELTAHNTTQTHPCK